MSNLKLKIAFASACLILIASTASIQATTYTPSVSTGQWIKYGNVQSSTNQTGVPEDFDQTDWMKLEVTDVTGKNVTLHLTGKYKNGTDVDEMGMNVNVETGWVNGSFGNIILIAGNLQENDVLPLIPLGTLSPTTDSMKINKTETRTYLGSSRTVNIVNLTMSLLGLLDFQYLAIYDKPSGLLLEMNMSTASSLYPSSNSQMSFSVTDTNVFAAGGGGGAIDSNTLYIIIAVVIIIVIVVVAAILMRKKPPTTPPSKQETSTSET